MEKEILQNANKRIENTTPRKAIAVQKQQGSSSYITSSNTLTRYQPIPLHFEECHFLWRQLKQGFEMRN